MIVSARFPPPVGSFATVLRNPICCKIVWHDEEIECRLTHAAPLDKGAN